VSTSWRRWVNLIVLVLVIGVLAYAGWWGYKALTDPLPKAPSCIPQSVGTALTSSMVTVRVYNAGTTAGLAKNISAQLTDKGFTIGYTGNTSEQVDTTTVIAANADDPQAVLVAGFFPDAVVQGDGRSDQTVDVLLPTNATFNENAPTQLDAPGTVICVPTPTPSPIELQRTATPDSTTPPA
jgi:hypothetical protein